MTDKFSLHFLAVYIIFLFSQIAYILLCCVLYIYCTTVTLFFDAAGVTHCADCTVYGVTSLGDHRGSLELFLSAPYEPALVLLGCLCEALTVSLISRKPISHFIAGSELDPLNLQ